MFTAKVLDKRLQSFISELEKDGYAVEKAILFGSYVAGTPHQYSDIDVAVWLKSPLDKHYTEIPGLLSLIVKHHPIKPIFYSSNETASSDPFIGVIEKTGKSISPKELISK